MLLNKAMALNPQASLPHYFLGLRAATLGQAEQALAYYSRTLELNPSYAPAYGANGFVLLSTGRPHEALDEVMRAIRLSPKDHYLGLWSLYVGRIHLELGNDQEAEHWLLQSVRLIPNGAPGRAALISLLVHKGDLPSALSQAAELARASPQFTLEVLEKAFTALSKKEEHKPKRLLSGLQQAFAAMATTR